MVCAVPPIFQPEVAAEAILFATEHRRREVWVGMSVVKTIVANKVWPGLLDRLLVKFGYAGQLTGKFKPADPPLNLFVAVPGEFVAHGRFDATARSVSAEFMLIRYRSVAVAGAVLMGVIAVLGFRTRNRQLMVTLSCAALQDGPR
jgi:hypothetical protein